MPLEREKLWDRLVEACATDKVAEIAELGGLTPQGAYKIQKGGNIAADTIIHFSDSTGVSPYWILTGQGAKYLVSQSPESSSVEKVLFDQAAHLIERKLSRAAAIVLGVLLEINLLRLIPSHSASDRTNDYQEKTIRRLKVARILSHQDENMILACSVIHKKALYDTDEPSLEAVQLMQNYVIEITNKLGESKAVKTGS